MESETTLIDNSTLRGYTVIVDQREGETMFVCDRCNSIVGVVETESIKSAKADELYEVALSEHGAPVG